MRAVEPRAARAWHLLTALVASGAVALQLWLVLAGEATLVEEQAPPTGLVGVVRFFSYFTILSNLLVALTTWTLALGRDRDERWWRVLRLNAVVGIALTGVVHWFLLRPLLDLDGPSALADRLLHVVVPLLALLGWALLGPRRRLRATDLAPSAIFPVAYLAWTLVHGALSDWYPYPFVDVTELGYGLVALNTIGVAALMAAASGAALWSDGRLGRAAPDPRKAP